MSLSKVTTAMSDNEEYLEPHRLPKMIAWLKITSRLPLRTSTCEGLGDGCGRTGCAALCNPRQSALKSGEGRDKEMCRAHGRRGAELIWVQQIN
jgi:hypothetical protein